MELAKWQYLDWMGYCIRDLTVLRRPEEGRTTNAEFLKTDELEKRVTSKHFP